MSERLTCCVPDCWSSGPATCYAEARSPEAGGSFWVLVPVCDRCRLRERDWTERKFRGRTPELDARYAAQEVMAS